MRHFSLVAVAGVVRAAVITADQVKPLFDFPAGSDDAKKADVALENVMNSFLASWDVHGAAGLEHWLQQIQDGSKSFLESRAATAYKTVPNQPVCEVGGVPTGAAPHAVAAYPGGVAKRMFGFDLTKLVTGLAAKANGPASASGGIPGMLAMQSLMAGMQIVKSLVSTAVQVLPPMVPPPVWNNSPLPCLPMVTGHNCFGAILHPITAADFIMADTTDAQLDGTIAGFPAMYAQKVGKTSDSAYKTCFSAYMSLQCASIFPMCSTVQAYNHPGPMGRLPLCFFHCIAPLVLCPGFWIEDLAGECQMASVPPMCTTSVFLNFNIAPPQYTSFEDSVKGPVECPSTPSSLALADASQDFDLYSSNAIEGSAYSTGAAKLPQA